MKHLTSDDMRRIANSILELVAHAPDEPGGDWYGADTNCGDATAEAVEILRKELEQPVILNIC